MAVSKNICNQLTNSETTNPKLHQFFFVNDNHIVWTKKPFSHSISDFLLNQNTIFIIQRIKQKGNEICFLPGCKYLIQNAKIGFVCIEIRACN